MRSEVAASCGREMRTEGQAREVERPTRNTCCRFGSIFPQKLSTRLAKSFDNPRAPNHCRNLRTAGCGIAWAAWDGPRGRDPSCGRCANAKRGDRKSVV